MESVRLRIYLFDQTMQQGVPRYELQEATMDSYFGILRFNIADTLF